MSAPVIFAFVAGAVATANPCGFALLPALFARRFAVAGHAGTIAAVLRALGAGVATTAGFLVVFGIAGTAFALGVRGLATALPWTGVAVGVVLTAIGIGVFSGRHLSVRIPVARLPRVRGGMAGDVLFGIGYGAASLSCTLPIFLAVVGTAATGTALDGALALAAYASGMGTVLAALAVAAALSRAGLARALVRWSPRLNRAGGAVLALAGAYITFYWGFFATTSGLAEPPGLLAIGARISAAMRAGLGADGAGPVLIGLLVLFVGWVVAAAARRAFTAAPARHRRTGPATDRPGEAATEKATCGPPF